MTRLLSFLFIVIAFNSADLFAASPHTGTGNRASRSRAATEKSQHPSINLVEFDKLVAQAADKFKQMQQQMELIQQKKETDERLRILNEHWTSLQAVMEDLHDMWAPGLIGCCGNASPTDERMSDRSLGGPMMGGMMNWHGTSSYYSTLTLEQLKQRQYMTDQYLAMQHQVIVHMMQHQHWAQQLQSPASARAR